MSDTDERDELLDYYIANAKRETASNPPTGDELLKLKKALEVFVAVGRELVAPPQQPGLIAQFMKATALAADVLQIDDRALLNSFEVTNSVAVKVAKGSPTGLSAEAYLEKGLLNGLFYQKFSEFPYVQTLLLAAQLGESITPHEVHTLGLQIEFAIEARRSPLKPAPSTAPVSKPS